MKKLLLLLLLLAIPAQAENVTGYFAVRYDLDSTSIIYCRSEGERGDPFRPPKSALYRVDNAGSETAVTSATAGQDVFLGMAAGDVMYITVDQVQYERGVLTYTDTENIVVDEAIDLSGDDYRFSWRRNNCGTAATDGWLSTSGLSNLSVMFAMNQYVGDAGNNGMDVRIEGMIAAPDGTTSVMQLWPSKSVGAAASVQNFLTAGITSNLIVNVTAPIEQIRVGMLHNTADDASGDLTTNAEQISVTLYGYRE